MANTAERHYTFSTLVEQFGLSRSFWKEAKQKRQIGFRKVGKSKTSRILFPESQVLEFLRTHTDYFPSVEEVPL
jgi:hypothetical protein